MSTCPVCKSVDAYYGIFGWNCISCKNSNKNIEEKICENSQSEINHPFDGGSHWEGSLRPDWGDLLVRNQVSSGIKCKICNESWDHHHLAQSGKCLVNIDEIKQTFYKHPI